MFCNNCGSEVKEGAKFCPNCGAQIIPVSSSEAGEQGKTDDSTPGAAPPNDGEGMPEAPAGKKRRKIWIPVVIIAAAVVVVLLVLAFTGVLTKKTVKLNDYVNLKIEGCDGYGTARATLDIRALGEDYDDKIKLSDEALDWGYYSFSDLIDEITYISVNPGSGLSNGDEVTIDWNVYSDYLDEMLKSGVKLSYEPEVFEVADLEPVLLFDAFAGINVEFSGISPEAEAFITYNEDTTEFSDEVWDYLYFSLDKTFGLAIGDTVTVTIDEEYADDLMRETGMYPEEISKDYVVEGIPYYVTSQDQIPEEGMEKLIAQADDVCSAAIAEGAVTSGGLGTITYEYIGNYFLSEKPGRSQSDVNLIYMVYKRHLSAVGNSDEQIEKDYYWYCGFRNGMVLDDGTFSIDYGDYFTPQGSYSVWTGVSGEAFMVDGMGNIYFRGYEDLDSMFNNIVTDRVSDYTYESTVDESIGAGGTDTESSGQESGADTAAGEKLTGLTATASSRLDDEGSISYGPDNLFDGDLSTAYSEGVDGVGTGEEINISLDGEYVIDRIVWNPGYQKSADLLEKNGYPTRLTFYFSDGTTVTSTVSGALEVGTSVSVEIPEGIVTDSIRIVIDEAAAGSSYEDTCISEMEIYGHEAG